MSWSFDFKAKDKQSAMTELSRQKQVHKDHLPEGIEKLVAEAITLLKVPDVLNMERVISVSSHGHIGDYGSNGIFKVEVHQVLK